jgi:hypothetical protein
MRHKRNMQAPAFIEPMAAVVVNELPEGPEWLYELKFDGYRVLLIKHEEAVRLHRGPDRGLYSRRSTVTLDLLRSSRRRESDEVS